MLPVEGSFKWGMTTYREWPESFVHRCLVEVVRLHKKSDDVLWRCSFLSLKNLIFFSYLLLVAYAVPGKACVGEREEGKRAWTSSIVKELCFISLFLPIRNCAVTKTKNKQIPQQEHTLLIEAAVWPPYNPCRFLWGDTKQLTRSECHKEEVGRELSWS